MSVYTVDAVAFIRYLVDRLPAGADRVFRRAESGEATLHLPAIAAIESLYRIQNRDQIKGVPLAADAEDVIERLETDLPVTVVEHGVRDVRRIVPEVERFSIHDAMIVASHRINETDAIVTSDPEIAARTSVLWE